MGELQQPRNRNDPPFIELWSIANNSQVLQMRVTPLQETI